MAEYTFDEQSVKRIRSAVERVERMSGDGVSNTPAGIVIGGRRQRPQRRSAETEDTLVLVKIASSASGGGKYNGRILTARSTAADVAVTGDLAESEIGTVPGANDALVLNVREVGKNTHDLSSSTFLPLIFLGRIVQVNSDGVTVVAIDGDQWENC
jgi:hypothetical protein